MSDTGIHISSEPDLDDVTVAAAADAIATILQAGHETHADQATIMRALDTLGRFGGVSGVSVANNAITMR